MGELSLSLPVVGEKDTTAEPKVTTALSEIQTQFNGKVATVNLEAEAVTPAKANKEILRIGAFTEIAKTRAKATKFKVSATRPALVSLALIGAGGGGGVVTVTLSGPAIEMFAQEVATSGKANLLFPILANEEWEWTFTGTEPTVKSIYLPL